MREKLTKMDKYNKNKDILKLDPIKQSDILKLDLNFNNCKTFYKWLSLQIALYIWKWIKKLLIETKELHRS